MAPAGGDAGDGRRRGRRRWCDGASADAGGWRRRRWRAVAATDDDAGLRAGRSATGRAVRSGRAGRCNEGSVWRMLTNVIRRTKRPADERSSTCSSAGYWRGIAKTRRAPAARRRAVEARRRGARGGRGRGRGDGWGGAWGGWEICYLSGGGGRTVVGIVEQGVRGSAPTKNVWGDLRGIGRRRGERCRRDERGERGGRGKRDERDDRGEEMAMSKRCVVQGRQVHGGVSVGEGTRAANRKQVQNPV